MVLKSFPYLFFFRYPSLRVAYIDEVEEPISEDGSAEAANESSAGKSSKFKPKVQKVYYSKLVKVPPKRSDSTDSAEAVENLDQVTFILCIYLCNYLN